ncbi:flagellar hook-associated protein FlgK [Leptospira interrogans]
MTLSNALQIAQSGISATASQTSAVSRNVTTGSDILTSRKTANIVTVPGAGVRLNSVSRVSDSALLQHMLTANSATGRQNTIVAGLDRLDITVSDPELDASPAALIGKLADALQVYSTGPQDLTRAHSAVNAAQDLVNALHDASAAVQATREQADADMAGAVGRLNSLLAQFETVNNAVVKGTRTGADVTDYLDARDRLLLSISEEIGVRTLTRGDNDMVIVTDGGVTLFETKPRSVTFEQSYTMVPGLAGNQVFIDGVQVTGNVGAMASGTGRLTGLAAVRDEIAVDYQTQLDEIARGLIEVFAESDQTATPSLADAPGLFTWPGAPAIPASGSVISGLAASIQLNPNVDPTRGGDPTLLRDGGMNGADYVYNASGSAGFGDRLQGLIDTLSAQRAFDPDTQLNANATLLDFASSSVGWLQELRKTANSEADYRATMFERSSEALSKVTGVNLDEEMILLLNLERSYQATSRLISTIDNMYRTLLEAAG